MPVTQLDSERLAAFRAVARERGFSKAARRLYKTQPAVSQAVAALEADLGVTLFHRLGRGVALTAEGQVLLEHVEEAFSVLDRARERLAALGHLAQGELALGASDTTTCYVLPPVLAAFRQRHPGVDLRIANRPSPATVLQVAEREVDLGFVTLPVRHPQLASEALSEREDVAIFAPDHPLAGRSRVRLERLLREPLLLLDRGSRTRATIDERIRETGLQPRIAMELASIEVIKRLVQLGFGVSIVPRIAVEAEISAGLLVCAPVFARRHVREVGAVYLARGPLTRAAEAFLELAREILPAAVPAPRST